MQWNARMSGTSIRPQPMPRGNERLSVCAPHAPALLCCIVLALTAARSSAAQLDMAALLEGQWVSVEHAGDCALRRDIVGVGAAEFTRSASRREQFSLHLRQQLPEGDVQVTAAAPPWHRRYPLDSHLTTLQRPADGRTLVLSMRESTALRAAMADGMVGAFSSDASPARGWPVPVSEFADAHARFKRCIATLPEANDAARGALARDKANSKRGARANLVRARVLFADTTTALNNAGRKVLRNVLAKYHGAPPVRRVVVAGYSDDAGDAVRNRTLSQQRAQEVTAFLMAGGIPADKIGVHYFGDNFPVADSLSSAGRAANRRATVQLER